MKQYLKYLIKPFSKYSKTIKEIYIGLLEQQYLPEVIERISAWFPDCSISIQTKIDIEENYTTVFIKIQTDMEFKNALKRNREMKKNWKLVNNKEFTRYFNISIETI